METPVKVASNQVLMTIHEDMILAEDPPGTKRIFVDLHNEGQGLRVWSFPYVGEQEKARALEIVSDSVAYAIRKRLFPAHTAVYVRNEDGSYSPAPEQPPYVQPI